jgi:hypothetical protein
MHLTHRCHPERLAWLHFIGGCRAHNRAIAIRNDFARSGLFVRFLIWITASKTARISFERPTEKAAGNKQSKAALQVTHLVVATTLDMRVDSHSLISPGDIPLTKTVNSCPMWHAREHRSAAQKSARMRG